VETLKEKGNEFFRTGDNEKALEAYSEVLSESAPPCLPHLPSSLPCLFIFHIVIVMTFFS